MDLASFKTTVKKYPVASVSAVVLVVMLAGYWFRSLSLADLESAYASKSEESRRLSTNIGNAAQLDDQLRDIVQANQTIASRLVNPQDLAINLQYFYKLEADTGIKLLDTRPTGASQRASGKGDLYMPVQYALSLQGGFIKALTFLKRLEQGTYYCRIVTGGISAAQSEQAKDKGSDEVVLTLTADMLGRKI